MTRWIAAVAGMWLAGAGIALGGDGAALPPGADAREVRPLFLGGPIANPAEQMHAPETQTTQPAEEGPTHPWELPPVNVYGQRVLREEDRVGSYAQPRWTTDRRFAETRVYVRPEGALEFEYWLIPTVFRKGPSEIKQQYELEFGLPSRFQLDLYLITRKEGSGGPTFTDGAIELRYALADWGRIWGNPTLYFEYTFQDQAPDVIETKLLLGGEIAPRWHWGTDLSFEHETGGQMQNTYEITGGLSYTVIDSRLSVGGELKFQENDLRHHRGRLTNNTFLGPSLQWRPLARMHVDVAPLIGITHESPALQAFFVLGWDF